MDWFKSLFTLSMILFPAVFTLCVRHRGAGAGESDRERGSKRRLWLATGAAAVSFLLLLRALPAVAWFMWMAAFPLWFLLAMPLLQARDPGWRPLQRGSRRSASLVRRDILPVEVRVGWIAVTTLWGLLLCAALLGLVQDAPGSAQWWLLAFNLAAGAELWVLRWGMRRSLIEPEPAAAAESAELQAERVASRRFKALGWLCLAAVTMLVFSLPPLLLIWYGNAALTAAIVIGAGGGTLAGIGGGMFGTLASIRRARINRLYLDLSEPGR